MNTDSCDMRLLEDGQQVLDGKPGDFAVYDGHDGRKWISMRLPSNGYCTLPLNVDRGWHWDGNLKHPTLQPSVWHGPRSGSAIEWHGWIRGGRMESC
jgi:hypothetical protein